MEVSGQFHVSGRFTSWETASGTSCIGGGWVGSRAGLDAVANQNPDSWVIEPEP
jgi:hypothetical protein